jgi:hypothetical protein
MAAVSFALSLLIPEDPAEGRESRFAIFAPVGQPDQTWLRLSLRIPTAGIAAG